MSVVVVAYLGAQTDIEARETSHLHLSCGNAILKKLSKQAVNVQIRAIDASAAMTDLHGL